ADRPAGAARHRAAAAVPQPGHPVPGRRRDVGRMKLPIIIVSLLGAGLAAAVLSGAFGGNEKAAAAIPPGPIFAGQHGPSTVTLTENGTLVAKDSQKLSTGTESSSKLTFLVEEGKTVAQDEVLAKLDTTELETDQQQITLDIVAAEANLATSKNELEI